MKPFRSLLRLSALAGLLSAPALAQEQEVVQDAACVDTNVGEFCLELLPDRAPRTVENFLQYLNDGDYDGTIIHRSEVTASAGISVIQGGGFYLDPLGQEVPQDPPVPNEFGVSNTRGTVAMAKLGGDPNSATSQWYVNVRDNTGLDSVNGGFTVFARVIKGMDVVDTINSYQRVNLVGSLGGAFAAVPVLPGTPTNEVDLEHFIQVNRVYLSDVVPEVDDGPDEPNEPEPDPDNDYPAVTTLRNGGFVLPIGWFDSRWGDGFYRVSFNRDSSAPAGAHVYRMSTGNILLIDNPPEERGFYNADLGVLSIPSVNVGENTFVDVILRRTDAATLQFTLESARRLEP